MLQKRAVFSTLYSSIVAATLIVSNIALGVSAVDTSYVSLNLFSPSIVLADTTDTTTTDTASIAGANGTYTCDTPDQKTQCNALLAETQKEINDLGTQLSAKMQAGATIAEQKQALDLQIKQSQLKIQAHQLTIAQLGKDITQKTNTITALSGQIDQEKQALSQTVRQTSQLDDLSIAEAFLSNTSLTNFFIDLDDFATIRKSLQSQMTEVQTDKQQNESDKDQLSTQQSQELDIQASIESEKAKIQVAEKQEADLLAVNQNAQQTVKTQIENKQAEAAKISEALFALRDTSAIQFGDAYNFAKEASAKTGVDPAFILAIIQQESNLGANVGSCYLADTAGNGTKISTGAHVSGLMKASRDVQPFLQITQALGRNPYKTPVSCPIGGVGYGGAMGPAQFIPSTWVLSENRVMEATGKSFADPWTAEDAFMASALYLGDLGAASSYSSEIHAACKYYGTGGSSCSYGKSVMSRVTTIQANIDILNSQ